MKSLMALADTLGRLKAAENARALFAAAKEFSGLLGFSHVSIAYAPAEQKTLIESVIYTDSRKHQVHELERGLHYADFDVVAKARVYHSPFTIGELQNELSKPDVGNGLPEQLRLGGTMIVPLHDERGLAAIAMFSGETPDLTPVVRSMLMLVTYSMFENYLRLQKTEDSPEAQEYSIREMHCLTYLGRGMTDDQIADLLGISKRTVRFHLDNVKTKLKATSRVQAIAKALKLRLIEL